MNPKKAKNVRYEQKTKKENNDVNKKRTKNDGEPPFTKWLRKVARAGELGSNFRINGEQVRLGPLSERGVQTIIQEHAQNATDEELAERIRRIESGDEKILHPSRPVLVNDLVLSIYKQEQADRLADDTAA
jgi:hypothetical protein